MFCYKLIEKNKALQKKFFDQLEKVRKTHDKTLEAFKQVEKPHDFDAGINTLAGINMNFFQFISAGLNFLAGYRFNKKTRDVTREILKVDDMMVTNLANDIITEYYTEYAAKKQPDQEVLMRRLIAIGILSFELSKPNKALKFYTDGLRIADKKTNKEYMAAFLGNIGLVYSDKGWLDEALEIYREIGLNAQGDHISEIIASIREKIKMQKH